MDVDLLSSPSKAQMDLMAMMMKMDQDLSELYKAPPQPYSGGFSPAFYNTAATATSHAPSSSSSSLLVGATPSSSSPLGGPQDLLTPALLSSPLGGPTSGRPSVAAMREMIFRIAAMQPIHIDPESVRPPKRRNVKISKDPQSVAARHRRERISERIRILQQLVPGGTKMDTASMLDEAIHYMKFLKSQVQSLQRAAAAGRSTGASASASATATAGFSTLGAGGFLDGSYSCFDRGYNNAPAQGFAINTTFSDVESK